MIEQIPISELNNNLMEDTSQICSIYGHLMKMSSTLHSCKNVNLYSFIKNKVKVFFTVLLCDATILHKSPSHYKSKSIFWTVSHYHNPNNNEADSFFLALFSEQGDQMNPSCLNLTVLRIPTSARLTFL